MEGLEVKSREREATDLWKNTSLNYLLHFIWVPLTQPPEAVQR